MKTAHESAALSGENIPLPIRYRLRLLPLRMFNGSLLGVFLGTIFALSVHFGGSFLNSASATPTGDPVPIPPASPPQTVPLYPSSVDLDGDRIPNVWETKFHHNPESAADAGSDFDNDGLTTKQEYDLSRRTNGTSGNPLGTWKVVPVTPSVDFEGYDFIARAINNLGDVLIEGSGGEPCRSRTFLVASDGHLSNDDEVRPVGDDADHYIGLDVNDERQVVGYRIDGTSGTVGGFIWDSKTGMKGFAHGGKTAYALKLNNRGDWIGWIEESADVWREVFVVGGEDQVLSQDGWLEFWFTDLNDAGEAMGSFRHPLSGKMHTFLAWRSERYDTGFLGAKPEFNDLTGFVSWASAMNQWGEFTGSSGGQSEGIDDYRAFHFNGDFHKVDISSNEADFIHPQAISAANVIVGNAEYWATESYEDAFIFRDGVGMLLEHLQEGIPSCVGDTRINESGTIITHSKETGEILIITPDQDADGDGMANDWEVFYGLDPANEADAYLDPDGDGINNLGEYSLRFSPGQYNPRSDDGRFIDTGPGVDDDEDGIPNIWEWQNGLDYEDPIDALQDPDRDGFSSLQEYQLNTNPHGAPTYRIREIGPFPNANSAITNLAKLGSGLDAESCLGPQEGTLMESVFFPASPLGSWDQRPAAWSLRRSEVQGSLTFYRPNSFSNWWPIAISASGAAIYSNGESPATLTYWPSQAANSVNLLGGINVNEVRNFEAVSLSPSGSWAAGWRTRNSTGEVEAVRWKMPSGDSIFQPVVLPLTATNGPAFTLPINTPLFVNDHGSVTTTARLGTSNRAVLWHSDSVFVLPTLGGLWSAAVGLSNDTNPIVAGNSSVLANGQQHATAWLPSTYLSSDSASDLGTLENGNYSAVTGIAPSGLISAISHVVEADLPSRYKTFIAKFVRPSGGPGYWKVFPQGGSASSILHTSITDAAEILGSTAELGQAEVPTLWRLGRAYPLNSVLPPSSGYHLVSIKALNSNSTLLATVNKDGVEGQILLTPDPDTDGDGLPDAFENRHKLSAYTSQPPQTDTDGDELTDLAEFAAGTDPCLKDSDTDGMYDGWEISWGFNPLDAYDAALDTDGDHVSNLREYQLLTNPVGLYRLETPQLSTGETFHSITPAGSLVTLAPGTNGTVVRLRHADKAYANGESEVLNDFALMSITEPSGGLVIRDELREDAWNWSAIWGIGPGFVRLADSLQADQESRPFTQNSLGYIIMSASGGLGAPPGFVEGFATGTDNSIIELQEFSANISTTLSPNGRFGLFTVYDASLPFDPTYSMFGVRRNEVIDTLGNSSILPFAPYIQVEQDPVDTNEDGEPDYYPPPIMEYIGAPFNWTALNNNGDAVGIQPGSGFVTCAAGLQEPQIFAWTAEISDRFAINRQIGYLPDRSFVVDSDDMWMPSYRINVAGSVMEATRIRKPGLSPWERIISFTEDGLALGAGTEPFLVLNGTTVRFSQLRTFRPEGTTVVLPLKDQPGMPVLNPVSISKGGKIVATTAVGTVFYLVPDNDLNNNGIADDYEKDALAAISQPNGTIDPDRDYDGDGYTFRQEWQFGSSDGDYRSSPSFSMDDEEGDEDDDGIINKDDADPFNSVIDWKKGPEPRFIAKEVPGSPDMSSPDVGFIDFSEGGRILFENPATFGYQPSRSVFLASINHSPKTLASPANVSFTLDLTSFLNPNETLSKSYSVHPLSMSIPRFNWEDPVANVGYSESKGNSNLWYENKLSPNKIELAGLLTWDGSKVSPIPFSLEDGKLTPGFCGQEMPTDKGLILRDSDGGASFAGRVLEIPRNDRLNWLGNSGSFQFAKSEDVGLAADVDLWYLAIYGVAVWRCQDIDGTLKDFFPSEHLSGPNAYHEIAVEAGVADSHKELLITDITGLQVAADGGGFVPAGLRFPGAKGISNQGWIAENVPFNGPCLWWGGLRIPIDSFITTLKDDPEIAVTEIHEMNSSGAICVSAFKLTDSTQTPHLYVLLPFETDSDVDSDSPSPNGNKLIAPDDFRQVSLRGRPMGEESPQDHAEVDLPDEKTSVDVYTRQIRHDTSHVYVPVPSSDLALQVTMSADNHPFSVPTPQALAKGKSLQAGSSGITRSQSLANALAFGAEASLTRECGPFGAGMATNLGAVVEVRPVFRKPNDLELEYAHTHGEPIPKMLFTHYEVTVPDETGARLTFISGNLQQFTPQFSRIPQRNEILTTLTRDPALGGLTLTKKFGVSISYEWLNGVAPAVNPPQFDIADPLRLNVPSYRARITKIADKYGVHLDYIYGGPGSVVPSSITAASRPGLSIQVACSSRPGHTNHLPFTLIDSITDTRGFKTTFKYRWLDICGGLVPVLDTVTKADGSFVRYGILGRVDTPVIRREGYLGSIIKDTRTSLKNQIEADKRRRDLKVNDDRLNSINIHFNLASIEDTLGNKYTFVHESTNRVTVLKARVAIHLINRHLDLDPNSVSPILEAERDSIIDQLDKTYIGECGGRKIANLTNPVLLPNGISQENTTKYQDTNTLVYEIPDTAGPDVITEVHLPGHTETNPKKITFVNGSPPLTSDTVPQCFPLATPHLSAAGHSIRVKDAEGKETLYEFGGAFSIVPAKSCTTMSAKFASGRDEHDDAKSFIQASGYAYTTLKISDHLALGTPAKHAPAEYTFSPEAGLALTKTTDINGNTVSYSFGDSIEEPTVSAGSRYLAVPAYYERVGFDALGTPVGTPVFVKFNDPTSETRSSAPADGVAKLTFITQYTYDGDSRLMIAVKDSRGNETVTSLETVTPPTSGPFKRRTDTMIYQGPASANDLRSHTHYKYSDTFHAFVTSETITKISPPQNWIPGPNWVADPDWVADRVTKYEPDNAGRVAITHLDPPTPSVPAALALDLITNTTYDNAGNKVSEKDPKGNTIAFTYDAVGHLSKVTYPDGTCKTYGYDLAGRKIRESDELGRATLWEYDPFGRPLKVARDMNGNQRIDSADLVTTTTYNKVGRPLTVTDPNGNTTTTEYDDLYRPIAITNALGFSSFLDYSGPNSGSGLLNGAGYKPTRTLDARGFVSETTYDAFFRPVTVGKEYILTGNSDWKTRTLDFASRSETDYDGNGNATETRAFRNATDLVAFNVTKTEYDAHNRPFRTTTAVGTPQQHKTRTCFTSTGLAWKTVAFEGGSLERHTETEYDGAGRPVHVWAPSPLTGLVRTPDDNPKEEDELDPTAAQTTTEYDKNGNKTALIDALGHRTETAYDNRNRPTLVTSPEEEAYSITDPNTGVAKSATTKTLYDDAGNPWMTITPRGAVTITEYDNANRPWRITTGLKEDVGQPNGYNTAFAAVTENTYDKNGNIVAVKDANGNITRNQYDALNRLTATATNPNTGEPSANFGSSAADEIVVANQYDAGGNLVAVADGEAVKSYNASTQSWLFSGSSGHVTTFDYDGMGRKISQTWDAGSDVAQPEYWTYDALVQLTHKDARNVVSSHNYDALLRPVSVTFVGPSEYADPARDNLAYTYAGSDSPGVSGPGPLVRVSYPVDTAANQTLRNVAYTHDRLDRPLTETSAAVTHTYGYDILGNRVLVKYGNANRTLVSQYDALNRVSYIIDTAADILDAADAISYSQKPPVQRLSTDLVTGYQYDVAGGTVFHTHPNGTRTSNQYDLLGRLKHTATSLIVGGAVLSACDYSHSADSDLPSGYDKLGNVCHVEETYANLPVPSRTIVNTYDKANRLKTEALGTTALPPAEFTPTELTTYGYDKANNRTIKVLQKYANETWTTTSDTFLYGTPAMGYKTNQLVGISLPDVVPVHGNNATFRVRYTYDANGNRATRTVGGKTIFHNYDALNRLVAFWTRAAHSTDNAYSHGYQYDYRTRRVQRDENFDGVRTITRLSFSGGSYIQTYVDTDTALATAPVSELIRGNEMGGGIGGLLYTVEGGAATHNLYNSRGDVISQASAAGSITWEAQYEAFGTRKAETPGTAVGRQKANTKDEDPTGLLNEGFRYRDLESGVFLTRDPMGFVDGPNVYTYVRQNPWTYYDPEGLFIDTIWDVANVLYDGGAIAWNIGATIGGGAVSMIGAATGNKFIEEAGAQEVTQAMRNLGNSAVDVGTDAFAALVPFAPAGASKVVRATDKTLDAVDAAKDGKKLVDKGKDAVDSARSIEKKSEAAVESATDAAKTPVKEGIYEFTDTTGKSYVGQSSNVPGRLEQHVKSGKLDPNTSVNTTGVTGGKTAREIAEHKRIQEITGGVPARFSDKVSNKVDPIGPQRRHLLDE